MVPAVGFAGGQEFAFDHYGNIRLYREYLAGRLVLPLLD